MIIGPIKNKKIKLGFGVVLVVLFGFVIFRLVRGAANETGPSHETITAQAQRGDLKDTVSASGQIATANYLTVTTSVNGIVNKVHVKEGDTVTKGQAIMDITLNSEGEESFASAWSAYLTAKNATSNAQTALITTESALINAEEDFEDEKVANSYQTHDERVAYTLAENAFEIAQANYDTQLSVIEQKQAALWKAWLTYQAQSSTIVAPGGGVIANIVVVEGMNITNSLSERTSSTVASIRTEGTPIASLNISEIAINSIKVGQRVELTLNSIEDKIFTGEVVGIDKIGTVASGVSNYPVIVKFSEDSNLVLPNMGVDVDIIIQEKQDVVYVPSAAIIFMGDKTMVRTEEGAKPVEVEIGIATTEHTEIVSGITEGTTVLINTLPTSGFTRPDGEQEEGSNRRRIIPGMGGGRR